MELTSLVSGMTEFAANLYPLKTEEELVALLSGMHHFPPGVPERARRVHERLPAGSALCSSDVGVLIGRLDTEGGLGGLYKHLAHTKEGPLHLVPSITHCAVCALNGEQVPLVVKSSLGNAFPRPTVYLDGRGGVRESVLYCKWCPRCNAKHNMSYAEGGTILQRGEQLAYMYPGAMPAGQPICAAFTRHYRPRAQRAPCLHTALADSFTLPSSSQAPQAIKRSAD